MSNERNGNWTDWEAIVHDWGCRYDPRIVRVGMDGIKANFLKTM